MKKVLVITAIITLLLAGFISCNGAVDERLWGSKEPLAETVKVTFVSNGGSEVASQTIVKGTCAVKPQDPTFGTNLFEGWFLKDSEELFDFSTPINESITLYAHWDKEAVLISKTLSNVAKNESQEVSIAASPANVTGQGGDSVTTISFPAGSFGDTEETVTEEINVIVYQTSVAAAKFTVSSQSAVAGLDLTVTVNDVPVTTFNNQVVKVTTYIAKNLTNVGIHYENENWTQVAQETDVDATREFFYDATTGKLIFGTTHFSQFLLSADEVAYVESNQTAYLDLNDALTSATDGDTVSLLKDIGSSDTPLTNPISVNKPLTFEGNGKTAYINSANNDKKQSVRIEQIAKGDVVLNDFTIITTGEGHTGLWLGNGNGIDGILDVKLDHITIKAPNSGYALMIRGTSKNTHITMDYSSLQGWGAVQNTSSNVVFIANNSEFDSCNMQSGGGDNNSYSSVIVAGYYNYNGNDGDLLSENNTFTFNNCSFSADKEHPEANVKQEILDIRSPLNNIAYLNNCSFEKTTSPQYLEVCYMSNYGGVRSDSSKDGSSKIFMNGSDVTWTDESVCVYLDVGESLDLCTIYNGQHAFDIFARELGYTVAGAKTEGNATEWTCDDTTYVATDNNDGTYTLTRTIPYY